MNYKRHIERLPAALKTATRAAQTLRDDDGKEIGTRPAEDYEPAQAWIIVKDAGGVLWFHHDQTGELLRQLVSPERDEPGGVELGEEMATLYKVDPLRRERNVRANRRIGMTVMARIDGAIADGTLIETVA